MPITNSIRELLARNKLYGTNCVDAMVDCKSPGAFSYITQGRVLPTPADVAILCRLLKCKPEELIDPKALDLTSGIEKPAARERDAAQANAKEDARPARPAADDGEVTDRFRFWLKRKEKREFLKVLKRLHFSTYSEWHRDCMREAYAKDRLLSADAIHMLDDNYPGNDPAYPRAVILHMADARRPLPSISGAQEVAPRVYLVKRASDGMEIRVPNDRIQSVELVEEATHGA